MIQRLPFRLPEWAPRTTWVSAEARAVWETRINKISQAWLEVERKLVEMGLRPSTLQNVTPENLLSLMQEQGAKGLLVVPLSQVARVAGYQSASVSLKAGVPFDYRVAITKPEFAAEWARAWSNSDNDAIGKLLGYPECCRKFFERVWVGERWMDTTIPQSFTGVRPDKYCNLLWRWHGVRLVSHLPCAFDCAETHRLGEEAMFAFEKVNMEASGWINELLQWPVRYTSLHGIAEITTPIHRTSVATDALAKKVVVDYHGERYPAEGAVGIGFPHRQSKPLLQLSNSMDNGFTSHAAMQEAHSKLLALLVPPYNTVLDLGCGDGVLLSKVAAKRRVGVERNERVAKLAEKRLDRVVVGDCTSPKLVARILAEEKPDLVLAQRDRNPSVSAPTVLSYSYENGVSAQLLVHPVPNFLAHPEDSTCFTGPQKAL